MRRFSSSDDEAFQFTHPVRGATYVPYRLLIPNYVSIHAPRAGCDRRINFHRLNLSQFQFTHPVRGATIVLLAMFLVMTFQFTHPVRGATDPKTI